MIAKAKAVAHGIRAMLYVSGESRNKKHPERITRICDNFMPQGMDASGIWTEMKFATMNHPNIRNNAIRIEISPAMEHTENFTLDDWQELWRDFAAAFDIQEIRDKDGKVVSAQTNISGSKSSIWLHEESKSGIPHLHAIVSRVDEKGNINNDHAIHLRAQRAAEMIARQRGWTTAQHIHETNIPKVSADCMEALRELDEWSWNGYQERLAAKGYDLYLRKDKKNVIRGYVLLKGNTKFKASELGKGRNLTASRIRQTWEKLHQDKAQQVRTTAKQPVVPTQKTSVPNGTMQKPQPVIRQNNPCAMPGIEVRIGDPETCEELPRGEVGEILCRGYNVMKGYYNMPEETARTISPDGWLHSGDLGTMDEDGYVRVTGRIKDMIIRGGENVYPREIEEFLMGMPGVLDIQVVAVPSRKYGEEVGAFIIARPDVPVAPEDVRAFCRGKIAWYKIPRYIAVVDGFPLTASGKIQKFKLREMAAERWPEAMAEPDSKTAK